MKRYYKHILSILAIVAFLLLHIRCNKSEVAQIDFRLALERNEAPPYYYGPSKPARVFPIAISAKITDKVFKLYPNIQCFAKYKMLLIDKQGQIIKDTALSLIQPVNQITSRFIPITMDTFLNIGSANSLLRRINTQYNIVRINDDTLSVKHYRILFTFILRDSSNNEVIDIPTLSPNQAQRTLDVIIDSTDRNKASYILSKHKSFIYSDVFMEKRFNIYFLQQKEENNIMNV